VLSFDDFLVQAGKIPYQYRHPFMLYALIKWLRLRTVVEVGTHIGMSAVWMARAIQENRDGRLYCIDPFCWIEEKQEEQWNKHIDNCGVRDVIQFVRGRSQEVEWPTHVDMAYIDGNHCYDVCRHDVEMAAELGARVIVLHDTVSWEGSRRYSDETLRNWKGWDFLEENSQEGLLIAKKRELKGPCHGFDIGEKWDKV
jgi:predicted O-methyltransferase YrrM